MNDRGVIPPEFQKILSAPLAEVSWKVQSVSKDKTKGLAVAYIDARDVANMLDSVPLLWQDSYTVHQMGVKQMGERTIDYWVVECKLTIGTDHWSITRCDVGTGDGEEAAKSAYSDAFKRAAVKFGIGRYLYALPSVWMPIDEYKALTKESLEKLNQAYRKKVGA